MIDENALGVIVACIILCIRLHKCGFTLATAHDEHTLFYAYFWIDFSLKDVSIINICHRFKMASVDIVLRPTARQIPRSCKTFINNLARAAYLLRLRCSRQNKQTPVGTKYQNNMYKLLHSTTKPSAACWCLDAPLRSTKRASHAEWVVHPLTMTLE